MTMIIGDLVNAIRVEDEENKEVAQKQEGSKSNVHDAEGDKNYAESEIKQKYAIINYDFNNKSDVALASNKGRLKSPVISKMVNPLWYHGS